MSEEVETEAEGLPLTFEGGGKTHTIRAPQASGASVSSMVSAVRLYHDDQTTGGAACLALLYRKLGKAAGGPLQSPRALGARAFDALVEQGFSVVDAIKACELAALHCVSYVASLNTKAAEDF